MPSRPRLLLRTAAPILAALFSCSILALDPGARAVSATASRVIFSMGTIVSLQVHGATEDEARVWVNDVAGEINRLAGILTVHEDDSPVRQVIERSGEDVEVPPEVAEVARVSLDVARDSGGLFEPTIGKLVDTWRIGFGGERVPSEAEIKEALRYVDWRLVRVGTRDGRPTLGVAKGQDIDFGGVGKGYIGTKAAEFLSRQGTRSALLSLGGNIVLLGGSPRGGDWRIGLQDPVQERNGYFAVLEASDTSVITSGAYERNLTAEGRTYGHILSPSTGYPVETDISSVTVVDPDGAKADAWCTAIFAMGLERARAFLASRPDIEAVLLSADGKEVVTTPGIDGRLSLVNPEAMKRTVISR